MGKQQIHRRLGNEQVKAILAKYSRHEIQAKEAMEYLEVGRTRLYQLAKEYGICKAEFSIAYIRSEPTRKLDSSIEQNLLKELQTEKIKIIDNKDVPVSRYNYSYIRNILREDHSQKVSLNTVIARAKEHGYWKPSLPKKLHDREVISNYAGELIQHDSSHHLFAPDAKVKWYLITSIDDYSRMLLYADLVRAESSWVHILAVQSVVLNYGIPFSYYADQHSIFRYVKDRDKNSPWHNYTKFTDDVDPQWRQVLKSLNIKPLYALSPQAKGKIERPYGWLQDHLVRTCVRNNVTDIEQAREILKEEVYQYNCRRVHSTINEIPIIRFQRAIKEKTSLFKEFKLMPPFQSVKDIFCLRDTRTVDAYRTISLHNLKLKVPKAMPRQTAEVRMCPDLKTGMTEIRFWVEGAYTGTQQVKNDDLPIVHF